MKDSDLTANSRRKSLKTTSWKDTAELVGIAAIVLGLMLVAYELRQNTLMMRTQTRDSLTEKQMMFSGWVATNEYTAGVLSKGNGKTRSINTSKVYLMNPSSSRDDTGGEPT